MIKKSVIPTKIQERTMERERKNADPNLYVFHPKMDGLTVYKVNKNTGKIEEV